MGIKSADREHALRVLLIGEDVEVRAAVKAVLLAVSEPSLEVIEMSPQAAMDEVAVAEIVMVIFDGNTAAPLGYLQAHAGRSPRPIIFGLLPERSSVLMRRVLQAGADELRHVADRHFRLVEVGRMDQLPDEPLVFFAARFSLMVFCGFFFLSRPPVPAPS